LDIITATAALKALLLREGQARQTIKSYVSAVKQLQVWWEKPLPEAKREDLSAYLTYLHQGARIQPIDDEAGGECHSGLLRARTRF
jgi:site-specific recombinase XerD